MDRPRIHWVEAVRVAFQSATNEFYIQATGRLSETQMEPLRLRQLLYTGGSPIDETYKFEFLVTPLESGDMFDPERKNPVDAYGKIKIKLEHVQRITIVGETNQISLRIPEDLVDEAVLLQSTEHFPWPDLASPSFVQ